MGVEAVLIPLGASVVRSALKLWLGDKSITAAAGGTGVDLLERRVTGALDQRRLRRVQEQFADAVVERVQPLVEAEYRRLPEHERLAAIEAVRETFEEAALDDDDLFAADLDARRVDRHLRSRVPGAADGLSEDAVELYGLLLRECAGYVIEVARGLPPFGPSALTEILRRETEIVAGIREVLDRLPQRRDAGDFSYDYRQLAARTLDRVEMFGATLSEASRRYPLSVAYISLAADGDDDAPGQRVEELLARGRRIFIRGEAGLGKTTLLQWIAVRSARRDFPEPLTAWNDTVPFLVPLRRYADRDLPAPERFLDEVGRHIAEEMPQGWVQRQLRSGRGLVLVDGVDELVADRRDEARAWLRSLTDAFPEARFVVTSRPSAVESDWLVAEGFAGASLLPMTAADVRVFARRWHDAMRTQLLDDDARAELADYEARLLEQLATRQHLRKLAGYPLLCALLCALHRDRRGDLPDNRMELYDTALQMLLERRDAERRLAPVPGLSRTRKALLLGDLAYWFLRNGLGDADVPRAVDRIASRLASMTEVKASADEVYRHLLERTGLLREPVEGRVDFVHRTFQEYLAAMAVVDADDIGVLVANAHLDQWHEVVVMAAGHASSTRRDELFDQLLKRGDEVKKHRGTLHLLALACLETAPELAPSLREATERRAADLLPPRTPAAARSVGAAGAVALGLLAAVEPRSEAEVAATIRAAAATGLDDAVPLIAKYRHDPRGLVRQALVWAWRNFPPDLYAAQVLGDYRGAIGITNSEMAVALRHLRGVRSIFCVPPGGPLDFLPPQVESLRLTLNHRADLGTLAVPGLRNLQIISEAAQDLAPLEGLTELRRIGVDASEIDGPRRLRHLPRLTHLRLNGDHDVHELGGPGAFPELRELHLGDAGWRTDLRVLDLAPRLRKLILVRWGALVDVRGVERWTHTLEVLEVWSDEVVNLAEAAKLANLVELHLPTRTVVDLRPLAGLSRLEVLTVGPLDRAVVGLTATWPALREIRVAERIEVDPSVIVELRDHRGVRVCDLRGRDVVVGAGGR